MAYNLRPKVFVSGEATTGWQSIRDQLSDSVGEEGCLVAVDSYPGVDVDAVLGAMVPSLPGALTIDMRNLLKPVNELELMLAPFLTEDRVFGYMAPFNLQDMLAVDALERAQADVNNAVQAGRSVLVAGPGAAIFHEPDLIIYADMPRWEIQTRMRAGAPGWLLDAGSDDALKQFKLGYFIEWRIADRWKMELFDRVDVFLDTTRADDPRSVGGNDMRACLAQTVKQPFRVVPFFDPGVWGGQWLKEHFGLPADRPNYAWGFDCVPEENSLLLDFSGTEVEVPSINVVLRHPEDLLGPKVYSRFGPEFPIRFDFLDTMKGGNLSLQVHPDTGYARDKFGISYTQDESYYMLAAEPDAHVYLGLKNGVSKDSFFKALGEAQAGGDPLDVERFVNRFPASQHDHFSIPAGTIHCAGAGCVVLEISATPYIFTFKLWDWGRLGLDGRPRPVHMAHGQRVLRDDRDTNWVHQEVLDQVETLSSTNGIREERTGLHPMEFIETRRHWFRDLVEHHTQGSVHVLNLVQGTGALVESPDEMFAPLEIGFAETFIVPASVGRYTIKPLGSNSAEHCTVRASVRV